MEDLEEKRQWWGAWLSFCCVFLELSIMSLLVPVIYIDMSCLLRDSDTAGAESPEPKNAFERLRHSALAFAR